MTSLWHMSDSWVMITLWCVNLGVTPFKARSFSTNYHMSATWDIRDIWGPCDTWVTWDDMWGPCENPVICEQPLIHELDKFSRTLWVCHCDGATLLLHSTQGSTPPHYGYQMEARNHHNKLQTAKQPKSCIYSFAFKIKLANKKGTWTLNLRQHQKVCYSLK